LTLLGQAIKVRRHELGFSQEELAWRAGLNRTYLTDVERGARNLSLATIDKLAEALEIPLSTLLHGVDTARGRVRPVHPGLEEPAQVEILLVEDNPRDIELALRALRQARLANLIRVARNGAEALDYLFCTGHHADRKPQDRPHLVLLDLKLPRVDGLNVLQRLKSDRRTRQIPVVVLTVSEQSRDISEARRLGAEAYIVKPVDFQRLSKVTPELNLSWRLLLAACPHAAGLEAK
jgi:CheY-like chemotaxis protein/DNA-binding XRE family transcriptional regulator